mmetsp:Transcript_24862/g.39937  ORF Transcript_24862/g.39937 Transcript_24862/m.39937 type:complete len:417 (+) Transcript_24862:48-1298(+)
MGLDTENDYHSLEALPSKKDIENKEGSRESMKVLGFWQVVFTVTNGMIGPVILVVPYSFALVGVHGWIMYAFAFFMFWFTGHCLYRAQMSRPGSMLYQSYPEIGGGLLGPRGRSAIGLSITVELIGLCAAFVVIVGDNLVKVQPLLYLFGVELNKTSWILAFTACVLPTVLMQNYGVLADMSKIGVVVCFSIPVIVIGSHIINPVTNYYAPEDIVIEGPGFNYENLPLALGIVSVAYTTHAIFPTVVARMKHIEEFPRVLQLSFGAVTAFYLLAGAGFYLYGKSTDPQITFNLPESSQLLISYAIIVTIFLKFALMLNPVILELEEIALKNPTLRRWLVQMDARSSFSSSKAATTATMSPNTKRAIPSIRLFLVGCTVGTAVVVPYIALIHSAVGIFWSTCVCVVIPCILALQVAR